MLKAGDVVGAKKLIAAPNFRPLMTYGDYNLTIFEMALDNDQLEIARLMMKSPAWKKTKWNAENTRKPLDFASSSPTLLPILKALARQKPFDLNVPDETNGEIPLNYAALSGNRVALEWLVKQPGARFNSRDNFGQTVIYRTNIPTAYYLLSLHKINVNARDNGGQTALHDATSRMDVDKIRALLDARGVNANLKDDDGKTALDLALEQKDENWKSEVGLALISSRKVKATKEQWRLFQAIRYSSAPLDAPSSTTTPYVSQN